MPMVFHVSLTDAKAEFTEFEFIAALTPSAQKAAFHVRDEHGRSLCLKIISPDYEPTRISREIHALQRINHPNVVRLEEYTFSSKPNGLRHYIIEEYVDGVDLAARLVEGQAWDISETAELFASLCDGLEALRMVEVVHRDLKPQNIRVKPDGSPVIIDFGVARLLAMPDLTSTASGAQFGTPAYFAPEQFVGNKHDIDHRTDLFALGIMMYQALLGEHPFLQANMRVSDLQRAVCGGTNVSDCIGVRDLPTPLKTLLVRLLNQERARRPHSAGQVAAILRRHGGGK